MQKYPQISVGDTVSIKDRNKGIVKYVGPIYGKDGIWVGIHLSKPIGKNDGSYNNMRYFSCPLNEGIFVKYNKILNSFGVGENFDYRESFNASMTIDDIIEKYSKVIKKEKPVNEYNRIDCSLGIEENSSSTPEYNDFYSTLPKIPEDYHPQFLHTKSINPENFKKKKKNFSKLYKNSNGIYYFTRTKDFFISVFCIIIIQPTKHLLSLIPFFINNVFYADDNTHYLLARNVFMSYFNHDYTNLNLYFNRAVEIYKKYYEIDLLN